MKKILLAACAILYFTSPSLAQNIQCPDRPTGDSSNACANTRFVINNGGGGGGGGIPEAPTDGQIYGRWDASWFAIGTPGGGVGTPGGSNLQVQYNNAGTFGGLTNAQLTAYINLFTSSLSGAVPASGGGTINFLRADGTWALPGGNAPVGSVFPWAGVTIPPSYALATGQPLNRIAFPDLFIAITFQPTLSCSSGSPNIAVASNISDRVPVGAPVEASACFSAGTTVASKVPGTLTLSTNAIATTSTAFVIFPWGNGDGSTTFNIPDLQGRGVAGRGNMSGAATGRLTSAYYGTDPNALNAAGGGQSQILFTSNLPPYTPTGTVSGSSVSGSISVTSTGSVVKPGDLANISSGGGGFSWPNVVENSTTGTITSTGSFSGSVTGTFTGNPQGGTSTPFSIVQPSLTLDYIIKVLPDSASTGPGGLVVGTTTITGGSNTNILYDNAGVLGEYALATLSDMYAGTSSGKLVTPGVIWPPEVTVTFGTTTTFNMSTFRDAVVTLTGNITTQTVSNVVVGKSGSITFIQDGTGSRTTVWDSKFKFAGGVAPVLTTTAGAVDILNYECRTSTFCYAAMMNDVK